MNFINMRGENMNDIQLLEGECIELMSSIKENTVDLILTADGTNK